MDIDSISTFAPMAECINDKMPSNFELTGLIHQRYRTRASSTFAVTRETHASGAFPHSPPKLRVMPIPLTWRNGPFPRAYQELMEHRRGVPPPALRRGADEQVVATSKEMPVAS